MRSSTGSSLQERHSAKSGMPFVFVGANVCLLVGMMVTRGVLM